MSIEDYLQAASPDRRALLEKARRLINDNLPDGFEEGILHGMISWFVPLTRYPKTYNGQPLSLVSLANQKGHLSLYLMCIYSDDGRRERFEAAYRDAGKKLSMGKSCLRFKKWEELAPDAIAGALREVTLEGFLESYEASRGA